MCTGDVLRPFLMYYLGGMYLDIDVECFRPADSLLEGWDMVLQSEYPEMQDISNAILASAPNLPYWEALMQAAAAAADAISAKRRLDVMDVLHATGPPLYTQVFKQVGIDPSISRTTPRASPPPPPPLNPGPVGHFFHPFPLCMHKRRSIEDRQRRKH